MSALLLFDSGVGGLSLVNSIREGLPGKNIVYVADTANFPYGGKTVSEVVTCTQNAIQLVQRNYEIDSLGYCCNTASIAVAEYFGRLIDPVDASRAVFTIVDAAMPKIAENVANGISQSVLATKSTVESGFFQKSYDTIDMVACDGLCDLIQDRSLTPDSLRPYLQQVIANKSKAVWLCCTHYIFVRDMISELLIDAGLVDTDVIDPTLYLSSLLDVVPMQTPISKDINMDKSLADNTGSTITFLQTGNDADYVSWVKELFGYEVENV